MLNQKVENGLTFVSGDNRALPAISLTSWASKVRAPALALALHSIKGRKGYFFSLTIRSAAGVVLPETTSEDDLSDQKKREPEGFFE